MSRSCKVCSSEKRDAIDHDDDSNRVVGERYGFSPAAVHRHRQHAADRPRASDTDRAPAIETQQKTLDSPSKTVTLNKEEKIMTIDEAKTAVNEERAKLATLEAQLQSAIEAEGVAPSAQMSEASARRIAALGARNDQRVVVEQCGARLYELEREALLAQYNEVLRAANPVECRRVVEEEMANVAAREAENQASWARAEKAVENQRKAIHRGEELAMSLGISFPIRQLPPRLAPMVKAVLALQLAAKTTTAQPNWFSLAQEICKELTGTPLIDGDAVMNSEAYCRRALGLAPLPAAPAPAQAEASL